jgi:hypothetical protein
MARLGDPLGVLLTKIKLESLIGLLISWRLCNVLSREDHRLAAWQALLKARFVAAKPCWRLIAESNHAERRSIWRAGVAGAFGQAAVDMSADRDPRLDNAVAMPDIRQNNNHA